MILVWPLLAGMFMIMVGNGLQGTLLSLRAQADGFPVSIIGVVMSLYYCGYLVGWYIVPRMIRSVGHIRVFAAFASLASTTILVQGLFVDPYSWGFIRILSGISFVGLFIVAESWLNNIATNKLRGQILSGYFFVVNGGFFAGQFLLNLAPIEDISLFVLVSVLISLSLVPITLANKPSPGYEEPENLPFRDVIKVSPLAVAGVLLSGFTGAGLLSIGPIYAQSIGFESSRIALFIAMYVLGCGTIPLLTGWLSDRMDRRKMVIFLAFAGMLICVSSFLLPWLLLLNAYLLGGAVSSIHSIAIAMMNDRLSHKQITSATASLILINGISSCVAPIILGVFLGISGTDSFFIIYALVFIALLCFGIYRNFTGKAIDVENQSEFHPIPTRASPSVGQISESA